MKETLLCTLTLSFLAGGALLLLPEKSRLAPSFRFFVGLLVLLSLLSPFLSFFSSLGDFSILYGEIFGGVLEEGEKVDYEKLFESALLGYGRAEGEEAVKEKLLSRFGVGRGDIEVTFLYENGEAVGVEVLLSGKGVFLDGEEVAVYTREICGKSVRIRKE